MSRGITFGSNRAQVHSGIRRMAANFGNNEGVTRPTPKAPGRDDTIMTMAVKPPGATKRYEFATVGEKFGPSAAQDIAHKRRVESSDDIRVSKRSAAIRQTPATVKDEDKTTLSLQQCLQLRDGMKVALEEYLPEKPGIFKQTTLANEIMCYTNLLIGHLQKQKSKDTLPVREKRQQEETILSREIVSLRSKRQQEETILRGKEQLKDVLKDIVDEVKKEAENKWNPLNKRRKAENEQSDAIFVEVEQLQECLNEMKRQKQMLAEKVIKLEKASTNLWNATKGWKNDSKDNENQKCGEESQLSKKLEDIIQQLDTKAKISNDIVTKEITETNAIKERITKIWISERTTVVDAEEERHFTPLEMLDSVEASFNNTQQELNRYKNERACINKELKELAKDTDDLTKKRYVEWDEAVDKDTQKEIRQIRSKLDHQKRFSERQAKQQDEIKWLRDLWNVVSEEGVAKKRATSGGADGDFDITEKRNIIIQNIKRWKTDREQVVSLTEPVLQEISESVMKEPLNFTEPKQFDTTKAVKGISPILHPVVTGIIWISECLKENCKSFHQKFVSTRAYNELKANEQSLLCGIENLKKDKDILLNRLSKVAGANLTDNNPNIADLSDPNRATKLAEQFSELYDNPWTDAFEVLETTDERSRIDFLLSIIVDCYNVCGTISRNQQDVLTRALYSPSEGMPQEKDANKRKKAKDISLTKVQSKALTELLKQTGDISAEDVKSFISTEHKEWVSRKELENYTMLCIELCWLMHLQSPPVFLDANVKAGTAFHTSRHKQYTKAGRRIDYLVWPALLLHEGGPILCKGVAQGK